MASKKSKSRRQRDNQRNFVSNKPKLKPDEFSKVVASHGDIIPKEVSRLAII